MQFLAALVLAIHGIAHLVGFRQAYWPPLVPVRRVIPLPRRLEGAFWLIVALAFVLAAIFLIAGRNAVAVLIPACALSLLLCLAAWPETKIGIVVDVLVLVLTLLLAPRDLGSAFRRETQRNGVVLGAGPSEVIEESALAGLPAAAQTYLRFMGVIGRPRDTSLRAEFSARFRRDEGPWLQCEALQLDTRRPISRLFMMQLALGGILPVTVRDNYVGGRGTMQAKAFDVFSVAEGHGYELDVGELVTYLNDAILMAPSLLLGPEARWLEVDARTFDVALTDGALTVTARVHLDDRGAPTLFSTRDRFFDAPDGRRLRTEWQTPIDGWQTASGRQLPTRARAVWLLPTGPLTYADFSFDPARISFNGAL